MTAVLRVNLGKTKDFRVGQRTTVLLLQSVQIFNLLGTEGQTFLLVIFLQIVHILDGLGFDINCKDVLIQASVHALQHLVVFSILAVNGEVLLNTTDALEAHVLCYLNSIRRPWRHHFATRTNVVAFKRLVLQQLGFAIKPA